MYGIWVWLFLVKCNVNVFLFQQDQYKILYMALLEAFRGRLRAVPLDKFLKEFQNLSKKSQLAREFEVHEKRNLLRL